MRSKVPRLLEIVLDPRNAAELFKFPEEQIGISSRPGDRVATSPHHLHSIGELTDSPLAKMLARRLLLFMRIGTIWRVSSIEDSYPLHHVLHLEYQQRWKDQYAWTRSDG
jgi:hypothetical protein